MLNYFNEIVVNNKIHFKKSDGTKCVDECGTQIRYIPVENISRCIK